MHLDAGREARFEVIEALVSGSPVISPAFGIEGIGHAPDEEHLESGCSLVFVNRRQPASVNLATSRELSKRAIETARSRSSAGAWRVKIFFVLE